MSIRLFYKCIYWQMWQIFLCVWCVSFVLFFRILLMCWMWSIVCLFVLSEKIGFRSRAFDNGFLLCWFSPLLRVDKSISGVNWNLSLTYLGEWSASTSRSGLVFFFLLGAREDKKSTYIHGFLSALFSMLREVLSFVPPPPPHIDIGTLKRRETWPMCIASRNFVLGDNLQGSTLLMTHEAMGLLISWASGKLTVLSLSPY